MYLHDLSTHWTSQCLHSGEYLFWDASQAQLTVRSVSYLERIWRQLLSWTDWVQSTAEKCNQLCQITLGALIAQVPFKPIVFSASLLSSYPELAKSCCEIWQHCAMTWVKSCQTRKNPIPTDLKHLMVFEAHRRSMNPLLEELAKTEPKIEPIQLPAALHLDATSLNSSSLINNAHLHIDANNLDNLPSVLYKLKREGSDAYQVKALQLSTQQFNWPHPIQKQCQEMGIALWPRDLKFLNVDSITSPETLIQCLMMNPQIQRIHFKPAALSGVIPANLAQAICDLPNLQFVDLGNYLWPLPISQLPKCLVKVPKEHNSFKPFIQWTSPTWSQLQSPAYLGPRVKFFCPDFADMKMSLPLGFVRRTGVIDPKVEIPPLEISVSEQEYKNLTWLFRIASRDMGISSLINKANLVDLLMTAYHWKMRPLIDIILSHLSNYRWSSDSLDKLPTLPTQNTLCPDLWIISSDGKQSAPIDRYQLALTHPHRVKSVESYPDFASVILEKHPQITLSHTQQYYSAAAISLNKENFEGFWALAISRSDSSLLHQVLNFVKSQALMKEPATTLERWHSLAISSNAHNLAHNIAWYKQKQQTEPSSTCENLEHDKFN